MSACLSLIPLDVAACEEEPPGLQTRVAQFIAVCSSAKPCGSSALNRLSLPKTSQSGRDQDAFN
jgi:hypothetical protein